MKQTVLPLSLLTFYICASLLCNMENLGVDQIPRKCEDNTADTDTSTDTIKPVYVGECVVIYEMNHY